MSNSTKVSQQYRKERIRKKVSGTAARPRLSIYRSLSHLYAQVVDDSVGQTLVFASTLSPELKGALEDVDKKGAAKKVGELVAKKCLEKDIKAVVFDRNGLPYHGRIAAAADGARAGGLQF
jgi:large subunit ribosomal protein L18